MEDDIKYIKTEWATKKILEVHIVDNMGKRIWLFDAVDASRFLSDINFLKADLETCIKRGLRNERHI